MESAFLARVRDIWSDCCISFECIFIAYGGEGKKNDSKREERKEDIKEVAS